MELRINSNATVKLEKFTGLKKVNTRITEFVCKNDTLEGKVLIYGSYFQNDLDKKYDFKEIIPFTVVFKDSNYSINDIACENFSFGEVVGRGLDCNFDVVVYYDVKKQVQEEENITPVNVGVTREDQAKIDRLDLEVEEVKIEELAGGKDLAAHEEPVLLKRAKETASDKAVKDEKKTPVAKEGDATRLKKVEYVNAVKDVQQPKVVGKAAVTEKAVEPEPVEKPVETEVPPVSDQDSVAVNEEVDIKGEDTSAQNELIKDEVTKHLDKVLQAKMEVKTDNDPTKKVKIGRGEEKKTTVKVIYYKNTNQIEHICHENNLSLDKVFKDNKDTNFDQYRRIIIK